MPEENNTTDEQEDEEEKKLPTVEEISKLHENFKQELESGQEEVNKASNTAKLEASKIAMVNNEFGKWQKSTNRMPPVTISAKNSLFNKFNFIVTLNHFTYGFKSVSGFKIDRRLDPIQEGGVNDHQIMVGVPTTDTPTLTFRRGLLIHKPTLEVELAKVAASYIPQNELRKAALLAATSLNPQAALEQGPAIGTIQVYDRYRKLRAMYTFLSLGMISWDADDLDADDSSVAYETITVAHTGLTRVPLDMIRGNMTYHYARQSSDDDVQVNAALQEAIAASWAKKQSLSDARSEAAKAYYDKINENLDKIVENTFENYGKKQAYGNAEDLERAKSEKAKVSDTWSGYEETSAIDKAIEDAESALKDEKSKIADTWETITQQSELNKAQFKAQEEKAKIDLREKIDSTWSGYGVEQVYDNADAINATLEAKNKIAETWGNIASKQESDQAKIEAQMEDLQKEVAKIADVWKKQEEKCKSDKQNAEQELAQLQSKLEALRAAQ